MGSTENLLLLAIIIIANLVVSLLGFRAFRGQISNEAAGVSGAPGSGGILDADTYLFIPYLVARGEKLPGFFLSNLSHAGWLHLAFNMFALFSFAGGVLRALGPASFLIVYVLAGIGCNFVVYALRKNDPSYRCLGASGSVLGIVTAAVVLDPTISVAFLFVPIPIPGPVFMLGYVLVSLYLISRNTRGGISHEGHMGGALAGLVVTGLLSPAGFDPLIQWTARALGF